MLEAAHGNSKDLPGRLQHAGVLVLQSLEVVGVSPLSLVDLSGVLEELIHLWHVVASFGVGIARNLFLLEFALIEGTHPLLGLKALERALVAVELQELLNVLIDHLSLLRLRNCTEFRHFR